MSHGHGKRISTSTWFFSFCAKLTDMCKEVKIDLMTFLTKILDKLETRAKDLYNNYLYILRDPELNIRELSKIISVYDELKKEYNNISKEDLEIIYSIENEPCSYNQCTNKYMVDISFGFIELTVEEYQTYIDKIETISRFESIDPSYIETYKRFIKKYFKHNRLRKAKLNRDIFFVNSNAGKNIDYIK